MKKTYSLGAELRALKTICDSEGRASQELLAKLDETHFATEVGKSAFKRILFKMGKTGDIPDWVDLASDPGLDVSVKEVLENAEQKAVTTKKNTKKLISRLQDYNKLRMMMDIGAYLEKQLKSPNPIDPDEVIAAVQNKMSAIRHGRQFKMMRIGKKSNVEKYLDKVMKGEAARYIPTGFGGFDDINRGVPTGSAMIIAGPTGGGKSLLCGQMANNMGMTGAKVGFFQLEMFNEESLQREVARVTGTDMTKLLDPLNRLKNSERAEIREAFLKNDRKIAKRGGQLDYFEFEESVTIEMLLSVAKPYAYDVVVIDYLGLLEGMSDENQWRLMSNAVRTCHLWAKQNDAVVIIAAQLSDEGMLRYSKGMAEHAKLMWSWKKTEQSMTTGIHEITQNKARQLSDHNFLLFFDKPQMRVEDASSEAKAAFHSHKDSSKDSGDGKRRKKGEKEKGKSSWKKDDSLTWGDSEDGDDEVPDPEPGPKAKRKPPKEAYKGKNKSKGPRNIEV